MGNNELVPNNLLQTPKNVLPPKDNLKQISLKDKCPDLAFGGKTFAGVCKRLLGTNSLFLHGGINN